MILSKRICIEPSVGVRHDYRQTYSQCVSPPIYLQSCNCKEKEIWDWAHVIYCWLRAVHITMSNCQHRKFLAALLWKLCIVALYILCELFAYWCNSYPNRGNWINTEWCENIPSFGCRISTQFLVTFSNFHSCIHKTVCQHKKCFVILK